MKVRTEFENDDEYVMVYPPSEIFQVKVTPEGLDIYYGKDQDKREDCTILRIKVMNKGLSLKTYEGKEFKRLINDIVSIGDTVSLPVEDWLHG